MGRGPQKVRDEQGNMNAVFDRIKERRRVLGVTQEDLCGRIAEASGGRWVPSRKDVGRCETGTRIVSDIELRVLAVALECDPCWLFLGTPDGSATESSR
jgi:transcriptional regulator with XRE-family HTH domain